MAQLIVFFDGQCPLCNRSVRYLLRHDRRKRLYFAPLRGKTASQRLRTRPDLTTLVLLEGERELRYGKGTLRICWHLGGIWRLLGILSFLPGWLINPPYRLVARNRHLFAEATPDQPLFSDRLLP